MKRQLGVDKIFLKLNLYFIKSELVFDSAVFVMFSGRGRKYKSSKTNSSLSVSLL